MLYSSSFGLDSTHYYIFETSVKFSQSFRLTIIGEKYQVDTKMGLVEGRCSINDDTLRLGSDTDVKLLIFDANQEILYDLDGYPIWVLKMVKHEDILLKKNTWKIIHDKSFMDENGFDNVRTVCFKYGFQYEYYNSGIIRRICKFSSEGKIEFEILFDEQSRFLEIIEY